jgi:hypothetical protein
MSDNAMRISVGEIATLAAWVEKQGLKSNHTVRLEQTQTGIGNAITAKILMTDDEGIFKDITDYDTW